MNMDPSPSKGRHFVLVHGACHGAWAWYKLSDLSDLLKKSGHIVSAIDLAGSGINPFNADDIRTWADNNYPFVLLMNALDPEERVIVVGHSMGGVNVSFMMEQFPHKICAAVFLAAFMPLSGTCVFQLLSEVQLRIGSWEDSEFNYARGQHNPPTSFKFGQEFMRQVLYTKSTSEDITLAEALLRSHPLCEGDVVYTKKRYGSVRRVYMVTKEDKAIPEDLQRKMIAENPPDRVYEMECSDHSPFFCNPTQLADILIEIADINR
eukprot:Gb_07888 [translate_table: standard]